MRRMDLGFIPLLALSGFLVGVIVGLTGVGGGSLMTPLLVLLFGFRPAVAVGTDLLFAAVTKSGGGWVHLHLGNVDWHITRRLALGSLPAAAVTLGVLAQFDLQGHGVSTLMSATLAVALLATAASIVFRGRLLALARNYSRGDTAPAKVDHLTTLAGALLGVLVTLSSVGAGALGIAALTFLHPDLPTRRIVGSDIAHAVPLTLLAGLGHWWLGSVDIALLVALLIGSLPGIALGAQLAVRIPEHVLRGVLASVLVLVAGKLLLV